MVLRHTQSELRVAAKICFARTRVEAVLHSTVLTDAEIEGGPYLWAELADPLLEKLLSERCRLLNSVQQSLADCCVVSLLDSGVPFAFVPKALDKSNRSANDTVTVCEPCD